MKHKIIIIDAYNYLVTLEKKVLNPILLTKLIAHRQQTISL